MSAEVSRKPNRLIGESSPYLQQHAYNPVDWYPWGEEALRRARELDRPIFLSIGYSSCHWCHVMEHESFEDSEIAAVMNEHFVNIKVDREERPDLDAIYMTAVQMLTGSGGWPMSVFLTPDLKPFWGGTYFPPSSRYGRAGFKEILLELARIYRESRDKVEETARELTKHLAAGEDFRGEGLPAEEAIRAAVEYARRSFDPHHGGFGPAPKFPRAVEISMLLRTHCRSGDPSILAMCEKTLEAMALGGMYDQIGGGFHRYSTDAQWLVPHFEKMLYDNALLARAYTEAYQLTGNELYGRIAREVLDYVLREMTGPDGGFYSATDADSEGREGAFFVWTPEQVEAVLGREAARLFSLHYGITVGGNFEHSRSIPHVSRSIEETAKAFKMEPEEARQLLAGSRRKLYDERDKREKPFRDEKVLTAWNGLMISALARGAQVFDEARYREAAVRAARLILEELALGDRLLRTRKDGRSKITGFLDDYAFFCEALIDLYETTFEAQYLERARAFTATLLESFLDREAGSFFYTPADGEALIVRRKDLFDSATPSGNGVAALVLLRLERLSGEASYRAHAEKLLASVKSALEQMPMAFSSMLMALDFWLHPPVEVAIIGPLAEERTRGLLRAAHEVFMPSRVLAAAAPPVSPALGEAIPLLAGKEAPGGRAAAYVCRNFSCQAPIAAPVELRKALEVAACARG